MTEEEFAALYRQHRSALVWYLRCQGASQAEAADAVQDAFACALRATDQVRDRRAWPAWLRKVAFRCYLRSLARRDGLPLLTVAEVPDLPAVGDPAADAELREQEEFVLSGLAMLPPRQRLVFTLHYEGWSAGQIAADLGMDNAAVRQNIARARAALRNWIMQDSVRQGEPS